MTQRVTLSAVEWVYVRKVTTVFLARGTEHGVKIIEKNKLYAPSHKEDYNL